MKKLRITVNGVSYLVDVEVLEDGGASVQRVAPAPAAAPPPPAPAPVAPAPAPAAATPAAAAPTTPPPAAGDKTIVTPIAGIVVSYKVAVGDSVNAGDTVVIVEAMKMNTNVTATASGRVAALHASPGEAVKPKQPLLTLE